MLGTHTGIGALYVSDFIIVVILVITINYTDAKNRLEISRARKFEKQFGFVKRNVRLLP